MIYLREIKFYIQGVKDILDIFDGCIKEDKIHWEKHHNAKAKYFLLSEQDAGGSK